MIEKRKWPNYIYTITRLKRNQLVHKTETTSVQPGIYYPKNCGKHPNDVDKKYLRAVFKDGEFNIYQKRAKGYQIFNYMLELVEAQWRWTLINFFAAFTIIWLFFAIIYWTISYKHGDFTDNHLPQNQNISNFTPCIKHIYSFTSAFLFSIEIHTTVAYGRRSITLECPETIIAMCFQCMVSSIFQAIMIGILFAKLTRPTARAKTILFSKHAIINLRDDEFCLIFRVGDIRKSKILNMKPKAYVVRFKTDNEELKDFEQIELKLDIDECESTFFLWPVTVTHIINKSSPFYGLSAPDLLCSDLEIIVSFEGMIESTGQPVQARTSFSEYDILWGHRFATMVTYNEEKKFYDVNFSKLSDTYEVDTPLCSAREYRSILAMICN